MSRVTLASGLLAALWLTSGSAYAQDAIVEGPGHEVSPNTVIHPTAGFEAGVDTNVFYEESDPVVSPLARLRLGFALATQGDKPAAEPTLGIEPAEELPADPTLDWRLAGDVALETYLSGNEQARDQTNINGSIGGKLVVFPRGTVKFDASENFARTTRPTNFESSRDLNRDINHIKLGLTYQPGGRSIRVGARYENTIDRFESSDSAFANRLQHLIAGRAEWDVLPITRATFETSFGFFGPLGDGTLAGTRFKNNSYPLRVQVGVATAITELTTLRGHIGYGNGFYSAGESFNNVLFGAEFGLRYSDLGRFSVGYQYDFQDSINANFYRDHAILGRLDQQLGLVVLSASGALRLRGYRGIPAAIGAAARDDFIVDAALRAHYLFRDWLAATGQIHAVSVQTDYMATFGGMPNDPGYSRVEATVGVTAAF